MKIKKTLCFMLIAVVFIFGCSKDNNLVPAPIGNVHTLEDLADSYSKVSELFPMNIQALPPAQKREFVEQVFSTTGYDYSETLLSMGSTKLNAANKTQKDLAELLLLPASNLPAEDIADLYSDEEVKAINHIKATF
jgi:hypothetical protein